ncbi:hypothetical protein RI367_003315 [Sorochytrium milnesiophthora]
MAAMSSALNLRSSTASEDITDVQLSHSRNSYSQQRPTSPLSYRRPSTLLAQQLQLSPPQHPTIAPAVQSVAVPAPSIIERHFKLAVFAAVINSLSTMLCAALAISLLAQQTLQSLPSVLRSLLVMLALFANDVKRHKLTLDMCKFVVTFRGRGLLYILYWLAVPLLPRAALTCENSFGSIVINLSAFDLFTGIWLLAVGMAFFVASFARKLALMSDWSTVSHNWTLRSSASQNGARSAHTYELEQGSLARIRSLSHMNQPSSQQELFPAGATTLSPPQQQPLMPPR